jgi:hypothetical protein
MAEQEHSNALSSPPTARSEGAANLPQPLQCPDSWKYTKEWDNNYEKAHGTDYLSKRCGHSLAQIRLLYYIYGHGEGILTTIKKQNLLIKRIAAGTANVAEVKGEGMWDYYDEKWEELFAVYNAHLAPPDILEIIKEVHELAEAGRLNYRSLLQYADNARSAIERKKQETEEPMLPPQGRQNRRPSWDLVEEKHSKVLEGFIYLLSNSLMPGVFKIGFSAGNPDKRAKDVSLKSGLPVQFEVVAYSRTKDPFIVEQRIHTALADYAKGGEFFQLDLELAKTTIEACIMR